MYNQNVKIKFFSDLPAYSVLKQYFKKTEKFENEYRADIGEMQSFELENTLKNTFSSVPKKNYLIHFKHRLKKYADWYSAEFGTESIRNNIDVIFDRISEIGAEEFFNVPKKIYFLNAKNLILEMNRLSSDDSSLLFKSAEILAWYGFSDSEMIKLKKENIKDGFILYDGKQIKLDRFSAEILEKFRDAEKYSVQVNCGRGVVYYADSPYLFRKRGRVPANSGPAIYKQNLRCCITEFSGKSDYDLGLRHTLINGVMSRAYIKEWEGDVPDIDGNEYYEQLFDVKMKKGSFENLILEYKAFKKYVRSLNSL